VLDLKFIREHLDLVREMLQHRRQTLDLAPFEALEEERRSLITRSDLLKNQRKLLSKTIGQRLSQGEDVTETKNEVLKLGDDIKDLDDRLQRIEEELQSLVDRIPNMPHPTVPLGTSEEDNVECARWGTPKAFEGTPLDHVALGTTLGLVDFERATKMTGARFAILKGIGAKLERALIQFMLDVHEEQGYLELLPPYIVNDRSLYGTGQFPKMKDDVFHLEGLPYYLIPTAEVPVTNYHADEILSEADLPLKYQAFSPCFRSEAGAHGKDTRGLIRQHQFHKVELVQFVHPDQGEAALESLREDAEEILKRLELPYRTVALCTADLSFSAAKCYDLEVWLPGQQTFREISSCSLFTDFQARRAKIRFKDGKQNRLVHTLNGSGLAVGRTWLAILENYQNADGSVTIPEVLRPYLGGLTSIQAPTRP
jgi:seryl-tRNA synthetase